MHHLSGLPSKHTVLVVSTLVALSAGSPLAQARTAPTQTPYDSGAHGDYVLFGNGWDGPGANPITLGYNFNNSTADMPVVTQQSEVMRAMNLWAKYANITWTPKTANQTQSIDILWATGNHGDGSSFDGPGGTLAHAFYPAPPNPETIAGDLHFDDAETYTTSHLANTNLYTVAIHELGHSLGLNHSADDKSIMYAFYAGGAFGNALSTDDIAGIRALYQPRYPTFSADVSGTHTWRSDLTITLGVKDTIGGTTLWETPVFLKAGGNLDNFDFSEIDLTDAIGFANGTNDWFVTLSDDFAAADSGDLNEFSIRFGTEGDWTTLLSTDLGALGPSGRTAYIENVLIPEPAGLAILALACAALRRRRVG